VANWTKVDHLKMLVKRLTGVELIDMKVTAWDGATDPDLLDKAWFKIYNSDTIDMVNKRVNPTSLRNKGLWIWVGDSDHQAVKETFDFVIEKTFDCVIETAPEVV